VDAGSKDFAAKLKAQLPAVRAPDGPRARAAGQGEGPAPRPAHAVGRPAKEYVPALRALLKAFKAPKGVTISANVDALSLSLM
jgi:hypothetical protein